MTDSNMTDAEHDELLHSTEPATLMALTSVLDIFLAHAKKTDQRIAELEKTPLVYEGPHEAGKVYDKNRFVTHQGSLWHCNYKTASRPGDGPAWTLAVKAGRDTQ